VPAMQHFGEAPVLLPVQLTLEMRTVPAAKVLDLATFAFQENGEVLAIIPAHLIAQTVRAANRQAHVLLVNLLFGAAIVNSLAL